MALVSPRAGQTARQRAPIDWYDEQEHRRKLAEALNLAIGRLEDLTAFVRDHVSVALYGEMHTSGTSGTYNLGAGWTQYTDFNAQRVADKGTTFNTSTDSFQVNANGIYMFYIGFTFDHDESNQGRSFNIRLFNSTDSTVVLPPIKVGVGRNTPTTNYSYALMLDLLDAQEDDDLIVELGNGSTITGTFDNFEIGVYSVGEIKGVNGLVDPAS